MTANRINKKNLNNLLHLAELPYPNLIDHLASEKSRKRPSIEHLLELSLQHECSSLFQLSQQCQLNAPPLHQLNQLEIIGFTNSNKANQYYKRLSQYLCTLTAKKIQLGSILAQKRIGYYLPNHVAVNSMKIEEIATIKDLYVDVINKIMQIHDPSAIAKLHLCKLFPPELFNVSDQPLLKNVATYFIVPNLPYSQLLDIESSLIWMSRFNLSSYPFFEACVRKLKDFSSSQSLSITDQLTISNCLFLLLRKLAVGFKSELRFAIFEVVQKLSIFRILFQSDKDIHKKVSSILQSVRSQMGTKQRKNQLNFAKIHEIYELKSAPAFNQSSIRKAIDFQSIIKLIRFVLLAKHRASAEQVTQAFNSPQIIQFIKKNTYLGDIAAQVIYADQSLNGIFTEANESVKLLLSEATDKFNEVINHEIRQQMHLTRNDQFQLLISSGNQLQIDTEKYGSNSVEKNIKIALMNDNEFIGSHLLGETKELIKAVLAGDLRNQIQDSRNKYPFYPDFKLMRQNQTMEFWLRSQFCLKNRVCSSQREVVLDYSNLLEMDRVIAQSMI